MDVVTFARARLDEWEQAIEVAATYVTAIGGSDDNPAIVIAADDGRRLWSTDQLRAQVAAMRAVVDLQICIACDVEDQPCGHREETLRQFAAIWSSHDDYDPGWAAGELT